MEYRISDVCNDLSIGKSTIYKRIELLKKDIPKTNWKNNEYFYYTENNKLFITEKGFEYIKNFNRNKSTDNVRQNSPNNEIVVYQNQIIEMYKLENEYLKQENKRLLDIISVKEQKELAKDMKYISNNDNVSFWDKFFSKFKR